MEFSSIFLEYVNISSSETAPLIVPLTTHQLQAICAVGLFTGFLSVFGFFFICWTMLEIPEVRKSFQSRLVFYMSGAECLWMSTVIVGLSMTLTAVDNGEVPAEFIPDSLCNFLGFIMVWFLPTSDFWAVSISLFLYLSVVHEKREGKLLRDIPFILLCTVPTFVQALLPLFGLGGGYGFVIGCLVDPLQNILMVFCVSWLCFLITAILYVLIAVYLYKRVRSVQKLGAASVTNQKKKTKAKLRILLRLAPYPIVLLLTWIPATANRIQRTVDPAHPMFILYLLHMIVSQLLPFFNSIWFATHNIYITKEIQHLCAVPSDIKWWFCCCKKPKPHRGIVSGPQQLIVNEEESEDLYDISEEDGYILFREAEDE